MPHALGHPNRLHSAAPILGALSGAASSPLSLAVLAALVLLAHETHANHRQHARRLR